jgi:hypothetical protein
MAPSRALNRPVTVIGAARKFVCGPPCAPQMSGNTINRLVVMFGERIYTHSNGKANAANGALM